WRRVQRGERGMIASGSARLGSGAKRAFILPYYVAAVVKPPCAPFWPDDSAALRSPRLDYSRPIWQVIHHVFDLVEDTALMQYPPIQGRGGLLQCAYSLGAPMAYATPRPPLILHPSPPHQH